MGRKIVESGKTSLETKYKKMLPCCVGLDGKNQSLRKLESLGINKNRQLSYDDPLYVIMVKLLSKQNHNPLLPDNKNF